MNPTNQPKVINNYDAAFHAGKILQSIAILVGSIAVIHDGEVDVFSLLALMDGRLVDFGDVDVQ